MQTEIEIKYRLDSQDALERVVQALQRRAFPVTQVLRQKNYFFDVNDWTLSDQNWVIRLRRQGKSNFITVKSGVGDSPADQSISVKLEYELAIDNNLADDLAAGRRDFREVIETTPSNDPLTRDHVMTSLKKFAGDQCLELKGHYSNERKCVPIKISDKMLLLELDATTFPNGEIHFEVELEIENEAQAHECQHFLKQLFHQAKVAFSNSTGKAERLFRIIQPRA